MDFYSYNLYDNFNNTLFSVSHSSYPRLVTDDLYLKYQVTQGSTRKEYASRFDIFAYNKDFSLYPMAVRYADLERGLYIIERPPFQIDLDFSTAKSYRTRKAPKYLTNAKMWIPWTVSIITFRKNTPGYFTFSVFFNNKPLSSFEDNLIPSYLPNTSAHGSVCLGQDSSLVNELIDKNSTDISAIYNQAFNDYFAGWNSDLAPRFLMTDYLKNIIDTRIVDLKNAPKFYRDLKNNVHSFSYVNSNAKLLARILFTASNLTLEEVFQYIDSCSQQHNQNRSINLSYILKNYISFKHEIYPLPKSDFDFMTNGSTYFFKNSELNSVIYNIVIQNAQQYPNEPITNYINNPFIISQIYKDFNFTNSSIDSIFGNLRSLYFSSDSVIQYNYNTTYQIQGENQDVSYTA
jgi:hypothetical protein